MPPREAWAWLGEHSADPGAAVLSVCGPPGSGKTAIVASFLKRRSHHLARCRDGAFYWDFCEDPSVDNLIQKLCSFAGAGEKASVNVLRDILREQSLGVVLDGLDYHQQSSPGDLADLADLLANWSRQPPVGTITDGRLCQLLREACEGGWRSLLVVTSRCDTLPDLDCWMGATYRALNPDQLKLQQDEAVRLLRLCIGQDSLSEEDGHRLWQDSDRGWPLELRCLAEEIRHKGILPFDCVGQNASSEVHRATIRRGFEHYASRLNTRQKMLTGLVALFRTPVPEGLVALLGRHLLGKHESMEFVNEDCLRRELDLLCRTGVLIRQPDANKKSHVYACRPAFRVEMVQWVLHAYSCADPTVLANDAFHRSVSREPGSIVQLMHAVISCLLQSGDQGPGEYAQADGLFRHQLSDGRMFFKAHDLETGAACVLQFVRDEARQRACERLLPNGRLSHYLHLAGLFLLLNGHTEEAGAYHAAAACRVDSRDVKILLNHSLIYSLTGNPSSAERVAREAAKLSKGSRRSANYRHSLCCLAHSLSLQGSMREADALFCEAQQESTEEEADGSAQLHEADLVLWAWHLLRQGKAKRAKQVMEIELRRDPEFTNSGETGGLVPFLRWLTAEADFKLGMLDKSLEEAAEIERVLKGGSALLCLPLVLLTKAKCHLGLRQLQDAHHACWEALKMAAKRKLNMVHGAACALLASILLETGLGYVRRQEIATSNGRSEDRLELVKKTEGFDDGIELDESALPSLLSYPLGGVKVHADHALNLGWEYAEVCRDAYTVLAEAAEIKGELDKQKRYAAEAIICSERLRGEVETNLGALESDSAVSRK